MTKAIRQRDLLNVRSKAMTFRHEDDQQMLIRELAKRVLSHRMTRGHAMHVLRERTKPSTDIEWLQLCDRLREQLHSISATW